MEGVAVQPLATSSITYDKGGFLFYQPVKGGELCARLWLCF